MAFLQPKYIHLQMSILIRRQFDVKGEDLKLIISLVLCALCHCEMNRMFDIHLSRVFDVSCCIFEAVGPVICRCCEIIGFGMLHFLLKII